MPNINQLKSLISKRGGLAPQNRFAVYMALPLISLDPQNLVAKLFKQDMTYIKKEYNTKKHDII